MLALQFYAPVFLIFYKFDSGAEGVAQAKELFMRHARHFSRMYAVHKPL
jgi:hypothetical protein